MRSALTGAVLLMALATHAPARACDPSRFFGRWNECAYERAQELLKDVKILAFDGSGRFNLDRADALMHLAAVLHASGSRDIPATKESFQYLLDSPEAKQFLATSAGVSRWPPPPGESVISGEVKVDPYLKIKAALGIPKTPAHFSVGKTYHTYADDKVTFGFGLGEDGYGSALSTDGVSFSTPYGGVATDGSGFGASVKLPVAGPSAEGSYRKDPRTGIETIDAGIGAHIGGELKILGVGVEASAEVSAGLSMEIGEERPIYVDYEGVPPGFVVGDRELGTATLGTELFAVLHPEWYSPGAPDIPAGRLPPRALEPDEVVLALAETFEADYLTREEPPLVLEPLELPKTLTPLDRPRPFFFAVRTDDDGGGSDDAGESTRAEDVPSSTGAIVPPLEPLDIPTTLAPPDRPKPFFFDVPKDVEEADAAGEDAGALVASTSPSYTTAPHELTPVEELKPYDDVIGFASPTDDYLVETLPLTSHEKADRKLAELEREHSRKIEEIEDLFFDCMDAARDFSGEAEALAYGHCSVIRKREKREEEERFRKEKLRAELIKYRGMGEKWWPRADDGRTAPGASSTAPLPDPGAPDVWLESLPVPSLSSYTPPPSYSHFGRPDREEESRKGGSPSVEPSDESGSELPIHELDRSEYDAFTRRLDDPTSYLIIEPRSGSESDDKEGDSGDVGEDGGEPAEE